MASPIRTRPVSQIYTPERLRTLLSNAEINAAPGWDSDFVSDLNDRFKTYGMDMLLSGLQRLHLERIASNF